MSRETSRGEDKKERIKIKKENVEIERWIKVHEKWLTMVAGGRDRRQ